MHDIKTVSIIGLGKLGGCLAAVSALAGLKTIGIDLDQNRIKQLTDRQVEEPKLASVLDTCRDKLTLTTDLAAAAETDASFFTVPTPSLLDGSFSNEHVLRAVAACAKAVKKPHYFVICSTVTPGSCGKTILPAIERITGQASHLAYNPKFIALGNVINGLSQPELELVGASDNDTGSALRRMYQIYYGHTTCNMSLISAELAKIALNSYITVKISFTNQLRMIATQFPEADINDMLAALGHDSRVGKKYFNAGLSYGGPCFPRDNRLFDWTAHSVGQDAPLARAADTVNERSKTDVFNRVLNCTSGTVAVLGMAYKPGTAVIDESPGLNLALRLQAAGRRVFVHDVAATPENAPLLLTFDYIRDLKALDPGIKYVIVCCAWPEYDNFSCRVPVLKLASPPTGLSSAEYRPN
jgi:UDPglucose 6-dehydrogenase